VWLAEGGILDHYERLGSPAKPSFFPPRGEKRGGGWGMERAF